MVINSTRLHNPNWQKLAERASLVGAAIGAIATAISQQVIYVYAPMALFLLLKQRQFNEMAGNDRTATPTEVGHRRSNQFNSLEQRLEQLEATTKQLEQKEQTRFSQQKMMPFIRRLLHQVQNDNDAAITELYDCLSTELTSLEQRLEHLETTAAQSNQNAQTLLPQQALTEIVSDIQKLQHQQQLTENTILSLQDAIALVQKQFAEGQQWVADLDVSVEVLRDRSRDLEDPRHQLTAIERTIGVRPKLRSSSRRGRVAIFIDSANLDYTARSLGIKIDYKKLLSVLAGESVIAGAQFYAGVDPNNQRQQGFFSCLRSMGYQIVDKPFVEHSDGTRKANVDVELALDMVEFVNCYDTAILVSGDGDFTCAVNKVKSRGSRVEVVSWHPRASKALIAAADCYIDLESIQYKIIQNSF